MQHVQTTIHARHTQVHIQVHTEVLTQVLTQALRDRYTQVLRDRGTHTGTQRGRQVHTHREGYHKQSSSNNKWGKRILMTGCIAVRNSENLM